MNFKRTTDYAPMLLRYSLAAVFLWFGASQLANPGMWTSLVPEWATGLSGLSASTIVQANGVFEIVMGALLAIGVFVPVIAAVLAVHLLVITTHLGLTAVGVRDFGLSFATFALALFGDDKACLTFTASARDTTQEHYTQSATAASEKTLG